MENKCCSFRSFRASKIWLVVKIHMLFSCFFDLWIAKVNFHGWKIFFKCEVLLKSDLWYHWNSHYYWRAFCCCSAFEGTFNFHNSLVLWTYCNSRDENWWIHHHTWTPRTRTTLYYFHAIHKIKLVLIRNIVLIIRYGYFNNWETYCLNNFSLPSLYIVDTHVWDCSNP